MKYDLLIRGGTVLDPSQELHALRDVAMFDGKVAAIGEGIAESEAAQVVDATGLIVTPGLVDMHVHTYWGASDYGIEPDIGNISRGVTTALDAGSAGALTFPAFRRHVLERSDTRQYALLNISAMGMLSPKIGELEDMRWADVEQVVEVGRANRDLVVGIKARLGRVQAAENDVDALKGDRGGRGPGQPGHDPHRRHQDATGGPDGDAAPRTVTASGPNTTDGCLGTL